MLCESQYTAKWSDKKKQRTKDGKNLMNLKSMIFSFYNRLESNRDGGNAIFQETLKKMLS